MRLRSFFTKARSNTAPDLSGGITLIYELQDTAGAGESGEVVKTASPSHRSQVGSSVYRCFGRSVDPSGTKEVSIREYGPGEQIEIIIPKASPAELDYIERKVYTAGSLEFRITASPVFAENKSIIELAEALPARRE